MPADELTALQRAAGVVGDLDPATAWDLDGQLDGLAQVTLTLAEGMGTWSERLHGIGLHQTVTEPIETGVTGLGEIAAGLTQGRRALRTAYAGFFAQAEANVRAIDRPAFWGENAVARGRHSAPPPAPAGEPVTAPAGWAAPQPAEPPAAAAALPRGQVEQGDGPLPDAADLAALASGHWHGSDVIPGPGETKVWLGLVRYAEAGQDTSGTYVVVDTATGNRWDPDSVDSGIIPALSRQEAAQLADELDDLIALAQSGTPADPPTKLAKLADRIRGLLGDAGVTITGNEGETEVSAAMIRQLLDTAAPAPAAPTRRKVAAKDCDQDNMDTGTVWIELDTSDAAPAIAVTSVEGNEQPEDYPEGYTTTKLPLADASQLAAKLRRFAQADADNTGEADPGQPAAEPIPEPVHAAPAGPRRVSNTSGKQFEYDPETGTTAVIERDGWRAVVPPSSSTGIAARLLYWNAEIKDGRGDDATNEAARALLSGLTATELREVADEIGASVPSSRTKPQMVDAITKVAVSSARKHLGLRDGGRERYVPPQASPPDEGPARPAPSRAVPPPGRSPEPIRPPNNGADQGLMHFDGALGRLWNTLGDDQHLQVDGRALGNVITDLGEGITRGKHDTNHAVRELRRIRTQLPDGSSAAQRVDVALDRLAAPDRPAPALPDKAPQQLKDLMADLNAIALVRRGGDDGMHMSSHGSHETDILADLTHRWVDGEISRGELQRGIQDMLGLRHESMEGWTEIRTAVARALSDISQWGRRPN